MFDISRKFELKVKDVHKHDKTEKKRLLVFRKKSVYMEDGNDWVKWSYKYGDWHEASYQQIQEEAEHRRQVIAKRGY